MMKGNIASEKVSFTVARLKRNGELFEVAIHPEQAMTFQEDQTNDIKDALVHEKIFADVKKGLAASEHSVKEAFQTDDTLEAIKQILLEGEIQLNTAFRRELSEKKRRQIIHLIASRASDPATGLPHPEQRIEHALEEVKVKIHEHKSAEQQIEDIVKKIQRVLPITLAMRKLEVFVPSQYASKAFGVLKVAGSVHQQEWTKDGSLLCVVELLAGQQQRFVESINKLTQGFAKIKIISE